MHAFRQDAFARAALSKNQDGRIAVSRSECHIDHRLHGGRIGCQINFRRLQVELRFEFLTTRFSNRLVRSILASNWRT